MPLRDQLQDTLGAAYRLERELGGGGMSRVFLAEETALGRKVVVKVLPPEVAAGVNADRFKREIQLAARLQHPHIVPVLSAGETQGVPYYTMPFVEGQSIRARLAQSGAISIGEVIGILRDVAKALGYAHERGIVHRDIKPDNVLLSGGSATVTDFGIAKAIQASRGDETKGATLTSLGSSIGTPAYMAPEQAAADPATNHRADIYAFGCMAFELLAGRPPFVAKTPQRLLAAHMSDAPEPITSHRPDAPDALADLVMRCLAKDADARPQSARDLLDVLDNITSGGSQAAMPSVLLGGTGMVKKALGGYVAAFVFVAVLAKAAIVAIGLPDWVFPGSLIVMALGLPVILFTAYVHHVTRRAVTQTPTYTPGGTPAMAGGGTIQTIAIRASPHVSWRRTWMGGVFAVGAFVALIGAYMALRALGIGPFGSLMAMGALKTNERLLVGDFSSQAADSAIAPVVTDAFRTALGQSRSVSVIQPNEIRDVLRRMERPPTTKVDFAVAREIATREGLRAIVDGEIQRLGGKYAVSVKLQSPQTGETFATFREVAASEDDLLPTIDKLAKDLRARIGESLRSVQTTLPLEQVTTPSLEALKKYVQGSRLLGYDNDWERGSALLHEAIALDSGFAMAYRRLAAEYGNRQIFDKQMVLLQKAFDHSNRLSDAERYLVHATYYNRGPKQDINKSTAAYEQLLELQPNFTTALNNVSINFRWQRDYAKAQEYLERGIATGSAPIVSHNQYIWTLWNQGKKQEAWRALARFDSIYPEVSQRHARRGELLTAEGKWDSAAAVGRTAIRQYPTQLTTQALMRNALAAIERTRGRLKEAARLDAEALPFAERLGISEARLNVALWEAAVRGEVLGDRAGAAALMDRALAETPIEKLPAASRPYRDLAYAYVGRPAKIREVMASFEKSRSEVVTVDDDVTRRLMRALVAFGEKRYDEAAQLFRAADEGGCLTCAPPLIAQSYDLAGKPDSALAAYERYFAIDDPFRLYGDQYNLAPARKRAGELYEAKGDVTNAVKHYREFVELWKNADPELQPRVAEVRRRIARLADVERRP